MNYLLVLSLAFFSLASCNDDGPVIDLSLRLGEVVEINGQNAIFAAVEADSRCPMSHLCIWEGIAIVQLEMENGDVLRLGTIVGTEADPANSISYDGATIRLDRLDPYPVDGEEIPLDDYRLFLDID